MGHFVSASMVLIDNHVAPITELLEFVFFIHLDIPQIVLYRMLAIHISSGMK